MLLMKKVTIADVAEKAGVSKPSVSRYLRQESVRPEIAEKIKAAIEETGYVARSNEKNAKVDETKRTEVENKEESLFTMQDSIKDPQLEKKAPKVKSVKKTTQAMIKKNYKFAVLVNDVTLPRTRKIIKALETSLYASGCSFQLCIGESNPELEEQYLTSFILQNVHAVFVEGCSSVEFIQKQMRTTSIPVIFLQKTSASVQCMAIDEVKAAEEMGAYLLEKKHLMIRYLGVDKELAANHMEGLKKAYHKLKQPGDFICKLCDGSYLDIFESIKDIFTDNVDLLILERDEMSIAVSKYLQEYHIAVPQNVSLISFGGHALTEVISPSLTCLAYEYDAYANALCDYTFALIEGKSVEVKENFFHMVIRESVR